ncbi:hypothetical protein GmHk_15G045003 [Glycine max]|nr:hypothetical protein GmHk_15G045003 [Glycine max]KAH1210776.1 hypothetical protein GmHk_15G045003 [Glycine max]
MGPILPDSLRPFLGGCAEKRHRPSRNRTLPLTFCLVGVMNIWSRSSWLRRGRRSWRKMHSQEALMVSSTLHPPSDGHVSGEMTIEATKEIAEKIDSLEEQATQGSFVPHGHQDVLTAAIGRPEHPGHVRAAGAGVTIKHYFRLAPRTSHTSSSLPPEELQQLTQQITDQLEESIIGKVTQQLMALFSQMQSQF